MFKQVSFVFQNVAALPYVKSIFECFGHFFWKPCEWPT